MKIGADEMVILIGVVAVVALGLSMWNLRRQDERMRRRRGGDRRGRVGGAPAARRASRGGAARRRRRLVLSSNAAALAMFDLARREFVDTHLVDQASGDDQMRLAAAIQRSFEATTSSRCRSR